MVPPWHQEIVQFCTIVSNSVGDFVKTALYFYGDLFFTFNVYLISILLIPKYRREFPEDHMFPPQWKCSTVRMDVNKWRYKITVHETHRTGLSSENLHVWLPIQTYNPVIRAIKYFVLKSRF